jgi:hypothetical protein
MSKTAASKVRVAAATKGKRIINDQIVVVVVFTFSSTISILHAKKKKKKIHMMLRQVGGLGCVALISNTYHR